MGSDKWASFFNEVFGFLRWCHLTMYFMQVCSATHVVVRIILFQGEAGVEYLSSTHNWSTAFTGRVSFFCASGHYVSGTPKTGVPVQTPCGDKVGRAILLSCSVDLPARAMLLNMKQWNGRHGCLYCNHEGVTLGTDHLHRYWPPKDSQVGLTVLSWPMQKLLPNLEVQ